MSAASAGFVHCTTFGKKDLAANRRGEVSSTQKRGPISLVVFGAVLGGAVASGGLLYAWSSRSSDVGCGRFTGCADGGSGGSETMRFLLISVPSVVLGLALLLLCVWDYRRQGRAGARMAVSTVRAIARDDSTDPKQPSRVLVVPAGRISLSPSVAARFEADVEYDVYYSGRVVLSFERLLS